VAGGEGVEKSETGGKNARGPALTPPSKTKKERMQRVASLVASGALGGAGPPPPVDGDEVDGDASPADAATDDDRVAVTMWMW
jgi:hypothetical protein